MSASLESLMRADRPAAASAGASGLINFILIGAGGAAAFVALSTLMLSLPTGAPEWLVNTLCYAALIGPVYLLHRRYSFRSDAAHRQALPRYVAVQMSALVLAAVFSFVVHGMLSLPTVFASMLVVGLTSGVNYLVLRSWAFAGTRWRADARTA